MSTIDKTINKSKILSNILRYNLRQEFLKLKMNQKNSKLI